MFALQLGRMMEVYIDDMVVKSKETGSHLEDLEECFLKDPRSFTIPCTISSSTFEKALCDLGASINLVPLSVFWKLGLGQAKPITISLKMVDRSLTYPRGVIEDVLVKVNN